MIYNNYKRHIAMEVNHKEDYIDEKRMGKTVLTFCVAVSLFMCSSLSALATMQNVSSPASEYVCSKSPDGYHHYSVWRRANAGYSKSAGTHQYISAYDQYDCPIYRDDCELRHVYQYCNYECKYCMRERENSQHEHLIKTTHSIIHN